MVSATADVPRLDGLPDAAATLALWEAAAGRRAEAMEWHLVFAGYRFALISERARALASAAGRLQSDAWGEANPAVRLLPDLLAGCRRRAQTAKAMCLWVQSVRSALGQRGPPLTGITVARKSTGSGTEVRRRV